MPISVCLTAWAKDNGIYFDFCGSKIQSNFWVFLTNNGRWKFIGKNMTPFCAWNVQVMSLSKAYSTQVALDKTAKVCQKPPTQDDLEADKENVQWLPSVIATKDQSSRSPRVGNLLTVALSQVCLERLSLAKACLSARSHLSRTNLMQAFVFIKHQFLPEAILNKAQINRLTT